MAKQRIDKLLSHQGFGTRKDIKKLLRQADVFLNGKQIYDPSITIDPQTDVLTIDDEQILNAGVGLGPVDAAINAIKSLDVFKDIDLIEYHVDAITGGTDAFIDVIIKLQQGNNVVSARGTEPDIINASVKAYIAGVNRLLRD